ncbi:MAG: hypothetical protein ABIR80_07940 [Opitutaceae bacterium]
MHLVIITFVVGLGVCGVLTLRHAIRTAVTVPPVSDLPAPIPQGQQPIDDWQSGIKADTRTGYRSDPATTKRLMEKLRQEEMRQRPQEGRN